MVFTKYIVHLSGPADIQEPTSDEDKSGTEATLPVVVVDYELVGCTTL
jgi:hypothetical protein